MVTYLRNVPLHGASPKHTWTRSSGAYMSWSNCRRLLRGCAVLQVIWYNSSDAKGPPPSNTWDPPSGAYMFRPNGLFTSTAPVRMRVVEGPVLTEIRQASSSPRCRRRRLLC